MNKTKFVMNVFEHLSLTINIYPFCFVLFINILGLSLIILKVWYHEPWTLSSILMHVFLGELEASLTISMSISKLYFRLLSILNMPATTSLLVTYQQQPVSVIWKYLKKYRSRQDYTYTGPITIASGCLVSLTICFSGLLLVHSNIHWAVVD